MIDLFETGVYLRKPGGNVENMSDQKLVPVSWAALNVGVDVGRDPAVWLNQRKLYQQEGVEVFPWMHCRSIPDIEYLIGIGVAWNSRAIGVNLEDVVSDKLSLQEVSGLLLDFWVNPRSPYFGEVHVATLSWVQNGQGWHWLDFAVAALEINPDETTDSKAPLQVLADHAFDEGFKKVTFMYGTKVPTWPYDLSQSHCLYTADDIPPVTADWARWMDPAIVTKPRPTPKPGGKTMLTAKQFPFTGPQYGPSHPNGPTRNSSTVKGLKRGMIRLGYLHQALGTETDDFGKSMEDALRDWQRHRGFRPASGSYGRASWLGLRQERLIEGPHAGEWAMDALALKYVKEDDLKMCYPHPIGVGDICQGLHPTAGLPGNWAMDFCAPGGTKVLAVERATIRKLSGHDPADGAEQTIGIFGWSIHYETAIGGRYFSTHYGSRANLSVGQVVEVGQLVGTVGHWPGDPSRSHTHLGYTSPFGETDAKRHIEAISTAARVAA